MITIHCDIRMQQRGIPQYIIDLLLMHGKCLYSNSNAEIYYFDKKSLSNMKSYIGKNMYCAFIKYRKCYLVMKNGIAVTTGWRYQSIKAK